MTAAMDVQRHVQAVADVGGPVTPCHRFPAMAACSCPAGGSCTTDPVCPARGEPSGQVPHQVVPT